jgi:hypothetical protein
VVGVAVVGVAVAVVHRLWLLICRS